MSVEPLLDRLLATLDVAVEAFAICEIGRDVRLVGAPLDAVEVHYVLAGTMHLAIEGVAPMMCEAGTIVVVPARLGQTMAADARPGRDVAVSTRRSMGRSGILVIDGAGGRPGSLRVACGLVRASIAGSVALLDRLRDPIVADLRGLDVVRHAFALMLAEVDAPGPGARALTGALMKACLLLVLRRHLAGGDGASPAFAAFDDPRLARAVDAVLDAPAAAHSVAALAATAGMSRSVFARLFSATFAMSPMEFVARTRLHHAAGMLRSTSLPVKAIAGLVGFQSRSHFSRAFRDAYNADPTSFRRQGLPATDQQGEPTPVTQGD